jgi:hypothetical protein
MTRKRSKKEVRGFEIKMNYPIWRAWAIEIVKELPNGGRKGIPRGNRIPFDLEKSICGLLMTIYPRGVRTTEKIGAFFGSSGDLVRKWRGEPAFQSFVQSLEIRFAQHVLTNLKDETFLRTLYHSSSEPFIWSNNSLLVFHHELINFLNPFLKERFGKTFEQKHKKAFLHLRKETISLLGYKPFRIELPNSSGPINFWYFMAFDLAMSAWVTMRSPLGKGHKKTYTYGKARFYSAEGYRNFVKETFDELISTLTNDLEEDILAERPKDELLESVRAIREVINIISREKTGKKLDEIERF